MFKSCPDVEGFVFAYYYLGVQAICPATRVSPTLVQGYHERKPPPDERLKYLEKGFTRSYFGSHLVNRSADTSHLPRTSTGIVGADVRESSEGTGSGDVNSFNSIEMDILLKN